MKLNNLKKFGLVASALVTSFAVGGVFTFLFLIGSNPPQLQQQIVYVSPAKPVEADYIPKHVVQAVLAAEDQRFYEHDGIDMVAVGRSLLSVLKEGERVQGAGTITMQLARNAFLDDRTKSVRRKFREAFTALQIEEHYTKNEILASYLNRINFTPSAQGISQASHTYFGKDVDAITIDEAALLAGMAKAPTALSPVLHPEKAVQRRNNVLANMRNLKYIDDQELQSLKARPLELAQGASSKR